ncbi:MAG: hypothetical protein WAJ92_13485 [Candidatus Acidiferrales bacterium]
MKNRSSGTARKKVVVLLSDRGTVRGYVNPAELGKSEKIDLLTPEGDCREIPLAGVKSAYFVRDFEGAFEPERKAFLSRPKLDGLWVRLRFRDGDEIEGIVPNDLLDLLDTGVQLTPPDLHGNSLRIFIPRTALAEMKVLGVVGVARRTAKGASSTAAEQSRLFSE